MTQPPESAPPTPSSSPAAEGAAGRPQAAVPATGRRVLSPTERRNRAAFWTFLRLFGGVMTLLALAYVMWTGGDWAQMLLLWVLLTIVADEFGGWFGYLGLLLGGLGYLGPTPPPDQWLTILPLVGGALFAVLLVKHSGGPFVLPFAALLFAGVLLATARFGPSVDPQLRLPANGTFQRSALLALAVGLSLSFVRQVIGMLWRYRARRSAA